MKVSFAQLQQQLNKGLADVYFVAGDEPLLVGEALDAIRSKARESGFEDREVFVAGQGFDWDSIRASAGNMSLFASLRIVEVRLPTGKPGRVGGPMLSDLAANPPPDTLLIIIAEQFDSAVAKSKWVANVSSAAVTVITRGVSANELPRWIESDLSRHGLTYDPEVVELLVHRVEGNLLAARQEIDKLALLSDSGHVDLELVQQSVADGARFDVFQLADVALSGDQSRAVRMLYGLRSEGIAAPLVLWSLVRESMMLASLFTAIEQGASVGVAMKQARVWSSRQQLVSACLRRHNRTTIDYLISASAGADRIVKGAAFGSPWDALLELLQAIGQPGSGVRGQLAG